MWGKFVCAYAVLFLCLSMHSSLAQDVGLSTVSQSCMDSARSVNGSELRKSIALQTCERESAAKKMEHEQDLLVAALGEYKNAVEEWGRTYKQMAEEKVTTCPRPNIFNNPPPSCSDLLNGFSRDIQENLKKATKAHENLEESLKQIRSRDSHINEGLRDLQNDREMKFLILLVFVLISVMVAVVVVLVARGKLNIRQAAQFDLRAVAAFAFITLFGVFGLLIDRIPESLIVAIVTGAAGWLFGTTGHRPGTGTALEPKSQDPVATP